MRPEIVLNIYDPVVAVIIVLIIVLLIVLVGMTGFKRGKDGGFLESSNQKGR